MKLEPVHELVAYGRTDFYGWPANFGMWRFGDDLLVGFEKGAHHYNGFGFHAIDHDIPTRKVFARLTPGGEWVHEFPEIPPMPQSGETILADVPAELLSEKTALMFQAKGVKGHAISGLYLSNDEGKSWQGPFRVPDFDMYGVAARTDYLVCDGYFLLGMTGVKPDGDEGTSFAARLWFDGRWEFLGMIGEVPPKWDFRIMPALARLPDGKLLAATRYAREVDEDEVEGEMPEGLSRTEVFLSEDEGVTWTYASTIGEVDNDLSGGTPPAVGVNSDGTVVVAYCRSQEPRGVFFTTTRDGKNWTEPVALRTDAVNTDMGYPRMIIKDDVAYIVYYYCTGEEEPRFVACTRISVKGEDLK